MPRKVFEGDLIAKGGSFAILVSRWNDLITSRLLEGALDSLKRHGVNPESMLQPFGGERTLGRTHRSPRLVILLRRKLARSATVAGASRHGYRFKQQEEDHGPK